METPASLDFFDVSYHEYERAFEFDASLCPRPRFCMALLLEGSAVFHDCTEDKDISVRQGDIVFVPMSSRYISRWSGAPAVRYISMHFAFGSFGTFSPQSGFFLQSLPAENPIEAEADFRRAYEWRCGGEAERFSALGAFYRVLSQILPHLAHRESAAIDPRIKSAVAYVDAHYRERIRVEDMAAAANMSVSRLFPCFRKEMGVTPVEYINQHRVNRAAAMLISRREDTVEQISDACGFESSAYFRRVFKKQTGASPREYRSVSSEI